MCRLLFNAVRCGRCPPTILAGLPAGDVVDAVDGWVVALTSSAVTDTAQFAILERVLLSGTPRTPRSDVLAALCAAAADVDFGALVIDDDDDDDFS
jgi:hypothetical protein